MKNPPLAAAVLIGLAALVGGVAWALSGDDPLEVEPAVVTAEAPVQPRVMSLTPHERRMKGRMEGAQRQLRRWAKEGEVLENGQIKIKDVDGSPLYVNPELVEGVGRYGEPIYAMVQYKRRPAVPLREPKLPKSGKPKLGKAKKGVLSFGEKPGTTATGGLADEDGGGEQAAGKKGAGGKKQGAGKTKDG